MKANYEDARSVLRRLKHLGHDAYLAGGCVRDMQLGLVPNDYDVTTSATPEQVQASFDKTVPVGASFGVVKVISGNGGELDVATFRTDGVYSDNRRPDSIAYSKSAEEDVQRRDFTINALLMDVDGKVIDYVGGIPDLKSRTLRTVGNAGDRFAEDALRMLRAIRFAVRFRMDIDEQAWLTIKGMKATIKNVSKERVTDELSKMFCYGNADRAYYLLRSSGLWAAFFEDTPDADDSWRALYALEKVKPEDPFILAYALIICEEYQDSRESYIEKLVLTNNQNKDITSLLDRINPLQRILHKTLSEQRKMVQWENLDLVLKFIEYQQNGNQYNWDLPYRSPALTASDVYKKIREVKDLGWPCPLVTGDDLISMGFIPGKVFTKMLSLVRDEQLEGRLLDSKFVKSFLISRFPATPRKLEDGTTFDDTGFRRITSPCPSCGRAMSLEVQKSPEGNFVWDTARNKINMKSYETSLTVKSACHSGRRAKSSFVEVQMCLSMEPDTTAPIPWN